MSGRLASFRGPSTPTSSPARQAKQPSTPASPSRPAESPYHRKTRAILQDVRTVTENWDDVVLVDGLKAAKSLVDARTDLDNELAILPAGTQPKYPLVQPKLSLMEKRISELDTVISKLRKQFQKLNNLVENLEALLHETSKTKGWNAVQEPLWVTWSLEKFATTLADILIPYHRSLHMHIEIVDLLRSHSVKFEVSREAINRWVTQPYLQEDGWEAFWEDLCEVEVDRWNNK